RKRLYRSTTTPPTIENRKAGNCAANTVAPSMNADCVSSYTTQYTAVRCIHMPISDTDCPKKYNLKLRLCNALNARIAMRQLCRQLRQIRDKMLNGRPQLFRHFFRREGDTPVAHHQNVMKRIAHIW